ncbi:MAG TPA: 50S ribosomal protein L17, partial [Nitrospinota bacterium]|nr:50S ribosomal protein L17 [Nitrospinota bacterium]
MRHLKSGRKLNRTSTHRKALMRNLVTAVLIHERIATTVAKAKESRRYIDKMITLGKEGKLNSRRKALDFVKSKQAVAKLFSTLKERYANRNGGYTRIFKIGPRVGDNAEMAIIELVDTDVKVEPKKKKE